MGELFNPVSIALHMLNAVILGLALYKLLYKPVRKIMAKRLETIQSQLDDAASRHAQAAQLQNEAFHMLEEAQRVAAETAAQSAANAEQRAVEIIDRATEETRRIRASADADIEKMRLQTQEALRDQSADLAVHMAEKLIGRSIDDGDHARLIDALVERL